MVRAGVATVVALSSLVLVASAPAAPPCPPGLPAPTFTANGGSGPVYTTQDLVFRMRVPGGQYFDVERFDVSGVRRLPRDAEEGGGLGGVIYATADAPGTLVASGSVLLVDASGNDCSASGTASFEARAASAPTVSALREPRRFKQKRGRLWSSEWSFGVVAGPAANRSPLTVEARAVRRARVPGSGVRAASRTFNLRVSDGVLEDPDPLGSCSNVTLICPPKRRTWATGAEVSAFETVGRANGVTVKVRMPVGAPAPPPSRRLLRTPAGVDVRVLQGGAVVARLRIAGLCTGEGQFAICRLKTLSTKLR